MNKTRLLRLELWSSLALAALFQAAFLLELHSPLPSALVLWSLSILSVACLAMVLLARRSLAANAKLSYAPGGVYRQRQFEAGEGHRVLGTYCVILCRQPLANPVLYPRTKCFYLIEASADRAVVTASVENPQWRAIGVEPPNVCARMPQSDRSHSTSETWHVA
ncbi:MAG TPA: hypothetical protein VFE27_17975 [Acidobacteriaceae bacterium]|nr:hypothetical protein [Acidobacteriaceae bacterium]